MIKKIKLEKSTCGKFMRVSFAGCIEILTMSEWSKELSTSDTFRHESIEAAPKPDFVPKGR